MINFLRNFCFESSLERTVLEDLAPTTGPLSLSLRAIACFKNNPGFFGDSGGRVFEILITSDDEMNDETKNDYIDVILENIFYGCR